MDFKTQRIFAMDFKTQRIFAQETIIKKKLKYANTEKEVCKYKEKEEDSFGMYCYHSYESRLKIKVKKEMMSEAGQGKKMSFGARNRLQRQLEPTIIAKVDEILENENHCHHVSWEKKVEVFQEIHSVEGQKLLKAHKKEAKERYQDLKYKIKDMKIDIILSELESLGITDTQILHKRNSQRQQQRQQPRQQPRRPRRQ